MVRLGKRCQIDRLVHVRQRQFTEARQRGQRNEVQTGEALQPHSCQGLERANGVKSVTGQSSRMR